MSLNTPFLQTIKVYTLYIIRCTPLYLQFD